MSYKLLIIDGLLLITCFGIAYSIMGWQGVAILNLAMVVSQITTKR